MRIAVTGGNGRLGSEAVRAARGRGHHVTVLDRVGDDHPDFVRLDITDYQAVEEALGAQRFDAVLHVAGMPGRTQVSGDVIFHNNLIASYNVLRAAEKANVSRIVYGSSETIMGLPFRDTPAYLPVDEDVPDSFSSDYGLAKHLEERMARLLAERNPETTVVALMLTTITLPEMYDGFGAYEDDPAPRGYNLWSYTDVRDAGMGAALATEYSVPGFERIVLAADDTVMSRPSADLIAEFHPGAELRQPFTGNESLFSNAKARRLLGFEPAHSWRSGR